MNSLRETDTKSITRRHFFEDCGYGLGKIALAGLLTNTLQKAQAGTHFAPKAKRVIHLFQAGAPSQLELFDNKPNLKNLEGKPLPPSVIGDQRYAFIQRNAAVLGPQFPFARHGQCGAELSDKLPHLAKVVDDIAIIRSMYTDQFNHAPGQIFFNTGFAQPGRPCLGSWLSYGLGAETNNLPAFVVLSTGGGISGGSALWSAGFMPGKHTGVRFRNSGNPILNVSSPSGVDKILQKDTLDLIRKLNKQQLKIENNPEITTRIESYEMAFRLQASAPELMDLKSEKKETLKLYGADPDKPSYARACLLARRMIERGVRCVNIYHSGWDAHSNVAGNITSNANTTDQASAALILDLKQRGLLDDTLLIWGGEFGRTPMVESNPTLNRSKGRDHHPQAFSLWLAGGGIKGGITLGSTDELGFHIAERPVHIHDLQATILHLLGLDHERLIFNHGGRDYRLTDVHGELVKEIIA